MGKVNGPSVLQVGFNYGPHHSSITHFFYKAQVSGRRPITQRVVKETEPGGQTTEFYFYHFLCAVGCSSLLRLYLETGTETKENNGLFEGPVACSIKGSLFRLRQFVLGARISILFYDFALNSTWFLIIFPLNYMPHDYKCDYNQFNYFMILG